MATYFCHLEIWFSCTELRMPGQHCRSSSVCRRGKFHLLKSDVKERVLREVVGGTEKNAIAGREKGNQCFKQMQEGGFGITLKEHTRLVSDQRRRPQVSSPYPKRPFSEYKREVLSVLSLPPS